VASTPAPARSPSVSFNLGSVTGKSNCRSPAGVVVANHLASIGFPKTPLPAALLVEMVFVSATVKGTWFKQPSATSWDLGGALVSYDDQGATLTLRKSTSAQVTVKFDPEARITITE
jgi:hypothetical protein